MSRVSSPEALEPVLFAPPSIGDAELGEVMAVLRSGWLTTGPRVERFEREFADYVGAPLRGGGELLHRRAAPLAAGRGRRSGR